MAGRLTMKGIDVPARREPAGVLYARASEYRRMAATASTEVDAQALGDLAVRFNALADEREFEGTSNTFTRVTFVRVTFVTPTASDLIHRV